MKKNKLGYPVISDKLYEAVFGNLPRNDPDHWQLKRAKGILNQFGIDIPVKHGEVHDVDLEIPQLQGDNIISHFEEIAKGQIGHHVVAMERLANAEIPIKPCDLKISLLSNIGFGDIVRLFQQKFEDEKRGNFWVKLSKDNNSWVIAEVNHPEEGAFVFDTETFVHGGQRPIIGTAISHKAIYLWLAEELVLPDSEGHNLQRISIGYDSAIIGHNVSFDRAKCQEPYELNYKLGPDNFWFDTMSAHIAVSGLASGQRSLYVLHHKDPDSLTDAQKMMIKKRADWINEGSTMSLVSAYNFHVGEPKSLFNPDQVILGAEDKLDRNIFVTAQTIQEIRNKLTESIRYALLDSIYTLELFQTLWKKYRECTPSYVGIAGHYYLGASKVPLVDDWKQWLEDTEKVWEDGNKKVKEIIFQLANKHLSAWIESNRSEEYWKSDPWLCQLNWKYTISKRGVNKGIPNDPEWFKKLQGSASTKGRTSHLLFKLTWDGYPLEFVAGSGWCYGPNKTKIPHPSGDRNANVGGVISKDFVDNFESGQLSSFDPDAKVVLEISRSNSFWTSIRKRVLERHYIRVENPYGKPTLITTPEITTHGTITRRTTEPVFATMSSTKKWKVGSELKTRLEAPEGWKMVGADFDSEEIQIASIYADADQSQVMGGSPMAFQTLNGSKIEGTDGYTVFAKNMLPERYAKVIFHPKYGLLEEI
jgi:DNA polymerase gamma 1